MPHLPFEGPPDYREPYRKKGKKCPLCRCFPHPPDFEIEPHIYVERCDECGRCLGWRPDPRDPDCILPLE